MANFVKLTLYNGRPIYINPEHIVGFYEGKWNIDMPFSHVGIYTDETPDPTFVKGNLRQVAKILGIDCEDN